MDSPRYRVIEYKPGIFRVQAPGYLWGWRWMGFDWPYEYGSQEAAEEVIKKWLADEDHEPRIVSEFK